MKISAPLRIAATCAALSLIFGVSALGDEAQDKAKLDAIKADLARVEAKLPEFNSLYKKCQAKNIPLDYPTVTKTLLEQFIPYAHEDADNKYFWRAEYAAKDMIRSIESAIAAMKAYLADPKTAPNARRYQTGKVDIKGLSFIGDRKDAAGKKDRGPLFFVGYGHFAQLRKDMPKWPGYGINIVQHSEFGPAQILTAENEINLEPIRTCIKALDDAAQHNVKVDVLLSPHYFPGWAMQKWPHLGSGGGGFLGYCVDAPEAKYVLDKFFKIVVPMIKNRPALHSFCISNEPTLQSMAGAYNTKPMWIAHLTRVHGDIKVLNERYGTSYKSWDEVPVPPNEAYTDPAFYDWCVFNMERFAGWHEWMVNRLKELAPNVPVHAKMMSMAIPHWFTISWGVDPELFGGFSDILGNDCLIRGPAGNSWSIPYHIQNTNYDLQRSVAGKPIFNSENHPTDDGSTHYVPPAHFRNALWQGAIHGQGATTTWIWERSRPWLPNQEGSFVGNVIDRPGCAEISGFTCLDLNRFADEVTALQNVKAPVAMLFSIPSIARATPATATSSPTCDHIWTILRLYTAPNFCGVKVDFITERQIAQGKAEDYKMIVVPYANYVQKTTFEAMKSLPAGTRLILQGNCFVKDPYNQPYPADEVAKIYEKALVIDPKTTDAKAIWPTIMAEFSKLGALPEVSVVDAATGQPAWGVEWLPAKVGGRTVINFANLYNQPVKVKVLVKGKEVKVRDLLSLGGKKNVSSLEPMDVALGEIVEQN